MGAAAVTMLVQVNALPDAEIELPIGDRHGEIHAGENAADMSRHVIVAFLIVLEHGVAVAHRLGQPALDIAAHGGIGILANHQRSRGVADEHMTQTGVDARLCQDAIDVGGYVQGATTSALIRQRMLHVCLIRIGCYSASFAASILFASAGLALPCDAFMTWPTR